MRMVYLYYVHYGQFHVTAAASEATFLSSCVVYASSRAKAPYEEPRAAWCAELPRVAWPWALCADFALLPWSLTVLLRVQQHVRLYNIHIAPALPGSARCAGVPPMVPPRVTVRSVHAVV